ncbi:MAG: DUF1015 family protein [Chitinophagales bacterium]|nr:DUF1015 family protein [Chitinophagales bacterium]
MIIKAFKGFRPLPELASKVALNPNNLLSDQRRKEEARKNPYSFAHVVKPRLNFPDDTPKTEQQLFDFARMYFQKMVDEGTILRDEEPCLYVYRLSLEGHTQTGLISCLHIRDYQEGRIKKHEHTRADKENENVLHITSTLLNSNPVFLAYTPVDKIDMLIAMITNEHLPAYDFVNEYGVRQEVWVVSNEKTIDELTDLFNKHVHCSYIADGHHRAAAAAIYAGQMADKLNQLKSNDFNYLLTCLFPANQLRIYDYNRLIKNLNGHTEKEFLKLVSEKFDVKIASRSPYDPSQPHRFGMYLNYKWYKLRAREGTYTNDAVASLDVSILQNNLLDPVLGIKDPRIDRRIDFVPGIKGLAALEKAVVKGKAAVAFSLFPVTMEQLFAISDMNEVMPPKSTWFEPKLMSGLIVFKMEL